MACPFCERDALSERIIAEDDLVIAFPTNIPITPGHALVVPKRHVETLEELSSEEKLALEAMRVSIASALRSSMHAEGFNYAWNEGNIAGQSVPHLHLHVVPRTTGDTGVYGYEPREFLYRPGARAQSPDAELIAVANQIRSAL